MSLPFLPRPDDPREGFGPDGALALALVSLSVIAALAAAVAAFVAGQPWWVVFGAYAGSGLSAMVAFTATHLLTYLPEARPASQPR
jgi:hypothetical protein